MFVSIPSNKKPPFRWATALLSLILLSAFLWFLQYTNDLITSIPLRWGILSPEMITPRDWLNGSHIENTLQLFTTLFSHGNWTHLLGNLIFLLIFGYPIERTLGSWTLLLLFLLGGALSNLIAILLIPNSAPIIIGASAAISLFIGLHITLFPQTQLRIILPLGLILEFMRVPAVLLLILWILLQLVFTYIEPHFNALAWCAHLSGFLLGIILATLLRIGAAPSLFRLKR